MFLVLSLFVSWLPSFLLLILFLIVVVVVMVIVVLGDFRRKIFVYEIGMYDTNQCAFV